MKKILLPLLAWGAVTMSVLAQPVITTQPVNQMVYGGSNVVFSVVVSGTGPFTYQWQRNGTNLANGLIATIAGGGSGGDGGPANQASLNYPCGVAADAAGNIYIADTDDGLVRKVDTNGLISTVAGGGTNFPGDGAAATSSSFNLPFSIVLDIVGNIYVADTLNRRVCKVDTNGIITTLAGNGSYGGSGDGGPATNALLQFPYGVAADHAGNLYISDSDANGIRKIDTNGIITRVVGSTPGFYGDGGPAINAGLLLPDGIALDGLGNMYIADSSNNRIRKVDASGIINTMAGGGNNYPGDRGPATSASLGGNPSGVANDASGNLYVADSFENRVCLVNTNGILTTVADNSSLYEPRGLAVDGLGNLLIADASNGRICEIAFTKSPVLKINNATTNEAGSYSVVVISPSGSVTSSIVGLTVVYPPQPQWMALPIGSSGGFIMAGAGSEPLNYQWYFNTNTPVPGGTNAGLNFISAGTNQAGTYLCVITNSYGSITSAVVTLLVGVPVGISNQPQNQAMTNGGFAAFSVGASGDTPFNYQWYFNNVMVNGETNAVLNIVSVANNNGGNYFCVVTNFFGSVTSSVATLTILLPPGISSQPKNQQVGIGSNGVFSVTGNGTLPLNFQWLFNGAVIAGATNFNYNFTVVSTNQAGGYAVIVTNNYGSVTSSIANLTALVTLPGITFMPSGLTVSAGSNALFTVVASGSPPFNYQWFFNSTPLDGQTNASLSLPNVTTNQAGAYSISVTSPYGSITSHIATLTVGWLPSITMQPTNQSVLAGNRALLTAGVSGVGPLTFQWQLNGTNLPNNLITTIAGNGTAGFAGDGGIATTGKIYQPYGVAADGFGNVFIADSSNNRIRKVSTNGVMTTVAGTGVPSFSGDGGAATNARIYSPEGVSLDASGNLYIADAGNNRIRKVDTNGIITTVVGNGGGGFLGDGGAATNATVYNPYGITCDGSGNFYIADAFNNRVRKVDTNGIITTVAGKSSSTFSGDGGAATNAGVSPYGVAVDAGGNLFIADHGNYRVRRVDAYGFITTIAGTGSSTFSGDGGVATNAGMTAYGVAVDNYGDVYIADRSNDRIRRVDPYGLITTVAGTNGFGYSGDGIPATNSLLYLPTGIVLDSYGRFLIADTGNNRIRRFGQGPTLVLDAANATNAGNYLLIVTSPFGSVTSVVATLTVLLPPTIVSQPASQSIGLGSNATFSVTAAGTQPLSYFWQTNGVNQPAQTNQTLNLTNVQWSDAGNYQVIITNNYGSITSVVATMTVGLPPSIISQPTNQIVLVGSNGLLSAVVSGDGLFTYQWQFNGTNLPPIITTVAGTNVFGFSGDGGAATNAKLNFPQRLAVDASGNLLIDDTSNNRIRKVDTNGIITTVAGTGVFGYSGNSGPATNAAIYANGGLGADAWGNFFIAEFNGGRVRKVDTNGFISVAAGGGGSLGEGVVSTNATINSAKTVAVDKAGNLFIADYYFYRIRKVGTNGFITTVAGNPIATQSGGFSGDGGWATNASMGTPYDVAVDSLGNFYIADQANSRIRRVDTNGVINTVIGGGASSSDGIQGTNSLISPIAVGVDRNNCLYVNSFGRIRKTDTNGVMTTVAGGGNNDPGDYGPATSAKFGNPMGIAFDAQGNLYIADRQRIRKVHFSGDPTLNLINTAVTNAGYYSVVVSSPFGSVVSSVATLTVLVPPQQFTGQFASGGLQIQFSGTPNYPYILQSATNLKPPVNWEPALTNPADGNGNWQFTDTNLNSGQKFYRAVGQ